MPGWIGPINRPSSTQILKHFSKSRHRYRIPGILRIFWIALESIEILWNEKLSFSDSAFLGKNEEKGCVISIHRVVT